MGPLIGGLMLIGNGLFCADWILGRPRRPAWAWTDASSAQALLGYYAGYVGVALAIVGVGQIVSGGSTAKRTFCVVTLIAGGAACADWSSRRPALRPWKRDLLGVVVRVGYCAGWFGLVLVLARVFS